MNCQFAMTYQAGKRGGSLLRSTRSATEEGLEIERIGRGCDCGQWDWIVLGSIPHGAGTMV